MSAPFLRPAARAFVLRWAEVGFCTGSLIFSLSVALGGGWVRLVVGGIFATLSAQWLWIALRRMRFARPAAAPGLVELDEGEIRYVAPPGTAMGGRIALADLREIRLISTSSGRLWQLKGAGQMLLVPVDARGAGALHDGFATLPGIDMGALSRALAQSGGGTARLWSRR